MRFEKLPDGTPHIATKRIKWNLDYQKKHGIQTGAAKDLPDREVRRVLGNTILAHESAVTAVFCFTRFPEEFGRMIEYIVQLGGDTDTIGAMAGGIWGAANVMPHECVRLYELLTTGKLEEALELWSLMAPANLFFWENDLDAEYLAAVKTATAMVGHDLGESRRPQLPLTEAARVALERALSTLPNRSRPA